MTDLKNRIQKLRDIYDLNDSEFAERMLETERSVKKAMLTKNLGEHDAVLMLRQTLELYINNCNELLSEDEDLEETKRREIFVRKRVYQWFLNLFARAEKRVASATKKAEENEK